MNNFILFICLAMFLIGLSSGMVSFWNAENTMMAPWKCVACGVFVGFCIGVSIFAGVVYGYNMPLL